MGGESECSKSHETDANNSTGKYDFNKRIYGQTFYFFISIFGIIEYAENTEKRLTHSGMCMHRGDKFTRLAFLSMFLT